jgi:hypothetical protein
MDISGHKERRQLVERHGFTAHERYSGAMKRFDDRSNA